MSPATSLSSTSQADTFGRKLTAIGRKLASSITPATVKSAAAALALASASLIGLGAASDAAAQVPPATGPGLSLFGPLDPVDQFPIYYQDRLGLRLQLCRNPAFCLFALPNPAAPMVFPTNYSLEQFYYHVGTTGTGAPGALLVYEHGLEATFLNGTVTAGDQVVFSRFRMRMTGLTSGATYTITHPYGTATYIAGVNGRAPDEINVTVDVGATPLAFNLALAGNVGPFLVPLGYVPGLPGSYIGNAVTEGPVQGSPFGTNFFRVDGPNVGLAFPANAVSPTRVQWNNFALQGQLAAAGGVGVASAHIAKQAAPASNAVEVWGIADSGVQLQASVPGAAPVAMKEVGTTGKYFGEIQLAAGAAAPASVTVTNITDVPPRSATHTGLNDLVTVQSATYIKGNNIYVTASSSDQVGNPVLTVTGTGLPSTTLVSSGAGVASGTILLPLGAVPPESITVTSAGGGSASEFIAVQSPAPVVANAGIAQNVAAGAAVTVSAAASTGPITTYAWSQTAGPTVTLVGANTATATFTAPNPLTAQIITLSLTVNGAFGQTSTSTVNINVAAVPAVVANAGVAQSVAAGAAVTVSAAASTGPITTYAWSQTAGPAVVLTGANTATATFNAPNPLVASVVTLSLTVNGAFGQTSTSTVNINVAAVPAVVANAGLDQLVSAAAFVSLSGAASSGPITTYAWSTNDPTIVLTGANTAAASFTAPSLPAASFITVSLTVTGQFGQTSTDTAIIAVAAVVVPPPVLTANAGATQNVAAGALVNVNGAGSSGPNPIVSYAWTQVAGPAVILTGANAIAASFTAPSAPTASSVTLQLTVTDSLAATASATVVINVGGNLPLPVANAGPAQNVAAGALVTLSGAASTGATSFSWAQTAGPIVTLTGAATASATFTAPAAATASVLTFTLTATNAAGSSTATVNVNVAAVLPPPVANAGPAQNVAAGALVTLSGAASTGATSFSWAQTAGPIVTLTGAATASATFTAPNAATASVLTFTLTATNASGSSTATVNVNVAAATLFANAGLDQNVAAGTRVTLSGAASIGATSFAWTRTAGPVVTLTGAATSTLSFTAPSAATASSFTFTLTVRNAAGATSTDTVIVNVAALVPLVANAGPAQTVVPGALVTLSGAASTGPISTYAWTNDAGAGVLTVTGANTVSPTFIAPPRTTQRIVTFTLTIRSAAGATATATTVVTIPAAADAVTITAATYTAATNRWTVSGTALRRNGQRVSVFLGAIGNTATPIGSALVSTTTGNWTFTTAANSGPNPAATVTTVWGSSALGGVNGSRTFLRN